MNTWITARQWTTRRRSYTAGKVANRHSGITLIEVCIALLVLAVAAGGMYTLANMANRISSQARSHYIATNLAKNRLETVKSRDFDQLANFLESNVVVNVNGDPTVSGEFRRTTFISGSATGLWAVTVQVGIRDQYSGSFTGEEESLTHRLADFQDKPK